jgi:hypothetical protein
MHCKVCKHEMLFCFKASVLQKYDVSYWRCDNCGLLTTEKPYWLEEAYQSPIALTDTGLVARNLLLSRKLAVFLTAVLGAKGRFADCAGGTGLLVRLMRDLGFDFLWEDRYSQNVHARGFEVEQFTGDAFKAVTAFEVLEHLEDPLAFIGGVLARFSTDTFIFSTELYAGRPPALHWWYYSFESGQHITFYEERTLRTMGKSLGLNFYSTGGLHVLTRQSISRIAFHAFTGRAARVAWPFVRLSLRSKTMIDHATVLRRMNGTPL